MNNIYRGKHYRKPYCRKLVSLDSQNWRIACFETPRQDRHTYNGLVEIKRHFTDDVWKFERDACLNVVSSSDDETRSRGSSLCTPRKASNGTHYVKYSVRMTKTRRDDLNTAKPTSSYWGKGYKFAVTSAHFSSNVCYDVKPLLFNFGSGLADPWITGSVMIWFLPRGHIRTLMYDTHVNNAKALVTRTVGAFREV
ncbi:hypothetical protein AVEN_96022-1 [Araneus ventricosus]|uniref:Uncharacterized protein n=1 Tax=Araneus ventricosus TaxID=182803 RepID=A0A4Y2B366_ARAVE|nr:hypothetical protein AVEN_96022-1 [Araneus ventricosus]